MAVRTTGADRRRHLRRAMQHLHRQRLRARRHADDRRSRPGRDPCCHHHVLPDIERQSCRGTDAAAPVAAGDRQVVRVAAATDRGLVAGKTISGAVGRVIEGAWQLRGLHAVQVGSLRRVAGDAGARRRRPGGPMRKRATYPVLRSAPGTGAWGGTQNWVGGSFAHGAAGTPAASTCVACHSSQRPDLNGVQPSQLPGSFDHSANGATDCLACHQSTVSRGSYAHYLPIPGGDWRGGVGAPAGLTFDVGQDVMVTTGIPSWSGTSIVSVTPRSETLPMQMLHGSSQVPAAVGTSCANCHVDAASGDCYPGVFHASLTALGAAQPSACVDCHAGAAPAGFVGPIATNPARNPASAEMKHDAVAWASGKPGTTALVTQDCARCHLPPLQATEGAWGVGRSGATPALYHASLATEI